MFKYFLLLLTLCCITSLLPLLFGRITVPKVIFALAGLGIALWIGSIYQIYHTPNLVFWVRMAFVGGGLWTTMLCLFIGFYPHRSRWLSPAVLTGIWVAFALMEALCLSPFIVVSVHPATKQVVYAWGHKIYAVYFVTCIAAFLITGFRKIKEYKGIDRLRLQYICYGGMVFMGLTTITNLIFPLLGTNQFSRFGPFFSTIFVGMMLFAILKHRFMDVELIIRKSVLYITVVFLVSILFTGFIVTLGRYSEQHLALHPFFATVIAASIIVILYPFLRDFIDHLTDTVFFRRKYDYQHTLKSMSRSLNNRMQYTQVCDMLIKTLPKTIKTTMSALYLKEQSVFKLYDYQAEFPLPDSMSDSHVLVQLANHLEEPVLMEELESDPKKYLGKSSQKMGSAPLQDIEQFKAALVVPITSADELEGILLLGDKRSELPYFTEDINLISTFVNQASTALQNARHYQMLQTHIRDLTKLNAFNVALNSMLDVREIIPHTQAVLTELFQFHRSRFFLEKGGYLQAYDTENTAKKGIAVPLTDTVRLTLQNGILFSLATGPAVGKDYQDLIYKLGISKTEYVIGIPFTNNETVIGLAIAVSTETKLTHHHHLLLTTLTQEVSAALNNALLYQMVVEMKNFHEEILENMLTGVIITSQELTIVSVNRKAVEMIGQPKERLIGRSLKELYPICPEFNAFEKSAYLKEKSTTEGIIQQQKNYPVAIATDLIKRLPDGRPGIIGVVSDLTPIKSLQRQVEQAERLSSLGTMAAGIAHEIKNPLVAIKTFSQMLPERGGSARFRAKYSRIVLPQIERINNLCQSLLRLGKPQKSEYEPVNIAEVVEEVSILLEAERKSHSAIFHVQGQKGLYILGNHSQMMQVLLNFLLNSLQSFGDRTDGEVTIRTEKTGNSEIKLTIEDNGCGISEADQKRIFDPFYTTKTAGTGLGLSIVLKVLNEHKGRIEVDSEPDKWTRFSIYLPEAPEPHPKSLQ